MARKKSCTFLRRNWWVITLLILSAAGIILGLRGFNELKYNFSTGLYKTFQLFLLKIPTEELENSCWLQWAKWVVFAVFLWTTFRLFFEIIAPQYLRNLKICIFKNHIIICGLNKITIRLVEKFKGKQIVVLAEATNKYAETLKTKGVKLLIGDFADEYLWWKAKLERASKLYAVIDNDKTNMKIAQSAFSRLETEKRKIDALKCFVLIKDRGLKTILEESHLFQRKTETFDGTLFNINEPGMKYGIAKNIDKILPKEINAPPKILLIGLTEKTEMALLNLAHCFTMQRETFRFTIVEKNKRKIRLFQKKYTYLQGFAKIKIVNEIESEKTFDSVWVCTGSPAEALKKAAEIRYLFGENGKDMNILVFCNEADAFDEVLKDELAKKKIFPIHLFEQIAKYVFELDKHIEEKAKEAHRFWNTIYHQNKEWDNMTGHFKQSNRNQILDNYLRIYIARGKTFEDFKTGLISFSDPERETLARMEHRRWMLEKLDNGWVFGERNNELKRHNCLVPWEELTKEQQAKDYDIIDLMMKLLNNQ